MPRRNEISSPKGYFTYWVQVMVQYPSRNIITISQPTTNNRDIKEREIDNHNSKMLGIKAIK